MSEVKPWQQDNGNNCAFQFSYQQQKCMQTQMRFKQKCTRIHNHDPFSHTQPMQHTSQYIDRLAVCITFTTGQKAGNGSAVQHVYVCESTTNNLCLPHWGRYVYAWLHHRLTQKAEVAVSSSSTWSAPIYRHWQHRGLKERGIPSANQCTWQQLQLSSNLEVVDHITDLLFMAT